MVVDGRSQMELVDGTGIFFIGETDGMKEEEYFDWLIAKRGD